MTTPAGFVLYPPSPTPRTTGKPTFVEICRKPTLITIGKRVARLMQPEAPLFVIAKDRYYYVFLGLHIDRQCIENLTHLAQSAPFTNQRGSETHEC
ncbi:MAG: hypothetical protein HQL52_14140 [Magnetococcales bacterium]|nr:hypothetical protein [Magnetococcales bacterium]